MLTPARPAHVILCHRDAVVRVKPPSVRLALENEGFSRHGIPSASDDCMRNNPSSWTLRFAAPVIVCMALVHCGGEMQKVGGTGAQPEAGANVGECGANGTCPSGSEAAT
jgi:hypothetical protein